MRKLFFVLVALTLMNYFVACSFNDNNSASKVLDYNESGDSSELLVALPDMCIVSEAAIEKINEHLEEVGCTYSICPVYMHEMYRGYVDEIKAKEIEMGKSFDLVDTGLWQEHISDAGFASSGYFMPINEYLKSDKGKELLNLFTEEELQSVVIANNYYSMPNVSFKEDFRIVMCIDKTCSSEKQLLTMDFPEIVEICSRNSGNKAILIVNSVDAILSLSGIDTYIYTSFSENEKKFVNVFEDAKTLEIRDIIKKGIEEGIIEIVAEERIKENNACFALVCEKNVIGQTDRFNYRVMNYLKKGHENGMTLGIPVASEKSDDAFDFIYRLYTDETLINLMAYGIEGVDYEMSGEIVTGIPFEFKSIVLGIRGFAKPTENDGVKKRREEILRQYKEIYDMSLAGFLPSLSSEEVGLMLEYNEKLFEWVTNPMKELPEDISKYGLLIDKLNEQLEQYLQR